MRFGLYYIELVATMNVLDDSDGVISDYYRNFHLMGIKTLKEVTFNLGLHVVIMLENIVIIVALGE